MGGVSTTYPEFLFKGKLKTKDQSMKNKASRMLLKTGVFFKPLLSRVLSRERMLQIKRILTSEVNYHQVLGNKRPFERDRYPDGINLIGIIRGEIGIGQSLRLITASVDHARIPYSIFHYQRNFPMRNLDKSWDHRIRRDTPYNINLIHLNPPEMILAVTDMKPGVWDYRYNIGFWLWELEEIPEKWLDAMAFVDEIWTPSEFISKSLKKKTDRPVVTMVYPILAPVDPVYDRKYFTLPEDRFLFLAMFDSNSIIQRKNPRAVIEAFKKAFDPGDTRVGLVVKINNPKPEALVFLEAAVEAYENIYLIRDILTKIQVNSLIKTVDVLVSLHRSEGFGLALAEAMLLGTPTIATNWSANTEFMVEGCACLVDYDLVALEEDYGPYEKGNHWAEPDIGEAAFYMKKLQSDGLFYEQMAGNAREYILKHLSLDCASKKIEERVRAIHESGLGRRNPPEDEMLSGA